MIIIIKTPQLDFVSYLEINTSIGDKKEDFKNNPIIFSKSSYYHYLETNVTVLRSFLELFWVCYSAFV